MKRAYCNNCEEEITEANRFTGIRVKVKGVDFLLAASGQMPADYDVCQRCVLYAVQRYEIRNNLKGEQE